MSRKKYPNCIDCGVEKSTYSQQLSPRCNSCSGKQKRTGDRPYYTHCIDCGTEKPLGTHRRHPRCTECGYNYLRKNEYFDVCQECGESKKRTKSKLCHGCSSRLVWEDDAYRDSMSAIIKETWSDPERRRKMSERNKTIFNQDEYKQMSSDRIQARWDDPEGRQKLVDGIQASWDDPEMRERHVESIREGVKHRKPMRGPDNPNWLGGKSFEPYAYTFNDELKSQIKDRDGNECKLCSETENLCVHHINYIKTDDRPENLVTLCGPHHSQTNFNREYWHILFMPLVDNISLTWYNVYRERGERGFRNAS